MATKAEEAMKLEETIKSLQGPESMLQLHRLRGALKGLSAAVKELATLLDAALDTLDRDLQVVEKLQRVKKNDARKH